MVKLTFFKSSLRRDVMEQELILPLNDHVFKSVFCQNLSLLRAFLVAVLGWPPEELDGLTVLDPALTPEYIDEKMAIVDLKAITGSGKIIHIEVQRRNQRTLWKRLLFYASRMVVRQMGSGSDYNNINQVTSIVLADFVLFDESEAWHHRIFLNDPITGAVLPGGMEFHILELPKMRKSDGTPLGNWIGFFNSRTKEQLMSIAQSDPTIREAVGIVKKLSGSERDRALADLMEKTRMDMEAMRDDGREEGIEIGLERGLEQGLEQGRQKMLVTARNMLQDKIEHAVIARWTGLSSDEIKNLAAELRVS